MKTLVKIALLCLLATVAMAQAPLEGGPGTGGQGRGRHGWMGRGVMGEITGVGENSFTIKTMQGNSATVKLSADTRIMRNREPIKMSDLKVGDTIGVRGTPDPNDPTTWNASFIVDRTAQMQIKQFHENLGKTFIAGEVKSIEGTNLTILRPDGQTQTISVDENTSFRKGRESVTLADIKAGDHVMGRGALKGGTFVATMLRVGGPGGGPGGWGMGMGANMGGRRWGGNQGQTQGQTQGQGQGQGAQPQ